LEFLFLRHLTF